MLHRIGDNRFTLPTGGQEPSRAPGEGGRGPPALAGGPSAPGAAILDTTTPPDDIPSRALRAWLGAPRSRRIFSRCEIGFALPGSYFFLTLTTAPGALDGIIPAVRRFRRWLRKYYPESEYLQVVTDEGNGTAHLVIRLPSGRIDVKSLRSYWVATHQTAILKIKRIGSDRESLSKYLADQSVRGMSKEMSHQPLILDWSKSRNWIPVHFIPTWKRYWGRNPHLTTDQKAVHTREWVRSVANDPTVLNDTA